MKVYIGPYINWFGPYQIADLLRYVGVGEERRHSIGQWLDEKTPIGAICGAWHGMLKREVNVQIHKYDVWNVDTTLAIITLPLLKKFRTEINGAPDVDDEDVPESLRRAAADPMTEEEIANYHTDSNWHRRWAWVVDEIIWAYTQHHPDTDWESQYHHGVVDFKFNEVDPVTKLGELTRTDKDTSWFDADGYAKHQARIDNGMRLFGKYYKSLWT